MSRGRRDGAGPARAGARTTRLYERHARGVYGLCLMLLRDPTEAEDALQSTFLAAHGALVRGGTPTHDAAWLAAIARNECRGRIRARMETPPHEDPTVLDDLPDPSLPAADRVADPRTRSALAALSESQREAVLLRDVLGLRARDVADVLGLSRPAVEALLFRARRQLRLRLRPAGLLVVPAAVGHALAEAIPGFVAPAAAAGLAGSAGGAAGAGVLAKVAGAPAAAKVAAGVAAAATAGSVAAVEVAREPAPRPAPASVSRAHEEPTTADAASVTRRPRRLEEASTARPTSRDDSSGPSDDDDGATSDDRSGRSGERSGRDDGDPEAVTVAETDDRDGRDSSGNGSDDREPERELEGVSTDDSDDDDVDRSGREGGDTASSGSSSDGSPGSTSSGSSSDSSAGSSRSGSGSEPDEGDLRDDRDEPDD